MEVDLHPRQFALDAKKVQLESVPGREVRPRERVLVVEKKQKQKQKMGEVGFACGVRRDRKDLVLE